jgi:hypothetical protein
MWGIQPEAEICWAAERVPHDTAASSRTQTATPSQSARRDPEHLRQRRAREETAAAAEVVTYRDIT